jgi:DNA-binding transcriptional LysR family regulator
MVVEEQSFSRAAERLNLSQPAVSMQIKSLEAEYHEELLHRAGKEITLTECGLVVYKYALQIIELDRKTKQIVRESRENATGKLSIASSSGPGESLIPKILGRFKQQYSDVEISLIVGDSDRIIDHILNYRYELGFVGISRRESLLRFIPFIHDELVLAVYPEHPWVKQGSVDFSDICQEPLILQQFGSGTTTVLLEALKKYDYGLQDLNILMELGLQESAKTAVENGIGVSFISRLGIMEELRQGTLIEIPVKGMDLRRDFYLVYLRNEPLTNLAEGFIEFAKESFSAIIPSDLIIY